MARRQRPAPPAPRDAWRGARRWILGFALLGLAVSIAATVTHYRLLHEPGYLSACDISETVSCSQVYLSRYGAVRGVPVAVGGLIWFTFALALAVFGNRGPAPYRESVPGYLFAWSTIGLSVVLYLAYASFFVLGAVCLYCLFTYAAVIGIFIVSGAATTFPMSSLPRRLSADLRTLVASPPALAVVLLLVGGAASAVAFFPREAVRVASEPGADEPAQAAPPPPVTAQQQSEFERWYDAQPVVNLPISASGAAVLVVKFTDYQCPACAQTYLAYKSVFAKYAASHPGAVRLVSRDFPLEPECNAGVTRALHAAACEAAVAVRLAAERGKAEAMEDWLARNHATLTPELVRSAARDVGGVPDLEARYAGALAAVKTDAALAGLNNVRSTPTFFINGRMIAQVLPPQFFDAALAYELRKAGK